MHKTAVIAKGIATGVAVGAVVGMVGGAMSGRNRIKSVKKTAGKALKTVNTLLSSVQYMMR